MTATLAEARELTADPELAPALLAADSDDIRPLIIIGGGPAGYTAAIYAARAGLRPLIIEGFLWGGQLMQTTEVENYPGFPEGVQGPELMSAMRVQAARFGADFLADDVTRVELQTGGPGGGIKGIWVGERCYRARAVIVATGSNPRKLRVPGEEELIGHGVSYCATCDAALYRDKTVAVVGGGNAAMEDALFLTRFAERVYLIHHRDGFSASPLMVERARSNAKIELLTDSIVEQLIERDGKLWGVRLRRSNAWQAENARRDEAGLGWESAFHKLALDGCFVAIGQVPNTQLFDGQLKTDWRGFLTTVPGSSMVIGAQGVYACGDVVDGEYQQAVTSAASGCRAALDLQRHLESGYFERDIFAENDETRRAHQAGLNRLPYGRF